MTDSALLIAIATATAYLTAFAYEAGQMRWYGIYSRVIDLQLLPPLSFLLIFVILTPIVMGLGFVLVMLLKWVWKLVWWAVKRAATLVLPAAAVTWVRDAFSASQEFVNVLNQRIETRAAKYRASTNKPVIALLLSSVVIVVVSFQFGVDTARAERWFWVTNETPETVVLAIYGNRVVTAGFDRRAKRLNGLYQILPLDKPGLVFRSEVVGPLSGPHPAETQ